MKIETTAEEREALRLAFDAALLEAHKGRCRSISRNQLAKLTRAGIKTTLMVGTMHDAIVQALNEFRTPATAKTSMQTDG